MASLFLKPSRRSTLSCVDDWRPVSLTFVSRSLAALCRFVNVCTEILALDAFTIADAVCQNEHLIDNLYGFLEGTPPLKPHTASHGSRILTALLNQRPKTVR